MLCHCMYNNNNKVLVEYQSWVLPHGNNIRRLTVTSPSNKCSQTFNIFSSCHRKWLISVLFLAADMNNHSVSVYKSFDNYGFWVEILFIQRGKQRGILFIGTCSTNSEQMEDKRWNTFMIPCRTSLFINNSVVHLQRLVKGIYSPSFSSFVIMSLAFPLLPLLGQK